MGIKNAGKNSFTWSGPIPVVNIMEPELIRDVLLKHNAFGKPPPHPLGKLLASGIVGLEGSHWSERRKIINPAFHLEKLKVINFPSNFPFFFLGCFWFLKNTKEKKILKKIIFSCLVV